MNTRSPLVVNAQAIPPELREHDHWVIWRREGVDEKTGKPKKPPFQARAPHLGASSTDPTTWASFSVALAAYERGEGDGIGFAVTDPYTVFDFDGNCRDPETGRCLDEKAAARIVSLNSYTEASQSGAGFHTVVRGKLPPGGRRKGGIEMYDEARFLYFTGQHDAGTPPAIKHRQAEVEALHAAVFPPAEPAPARQQPVTPVSLDDRDLIEKARAAKNGGKFDRLWRGETTDYSDDWSRADLALCSLLAFWTGCDAGRMDALFRQSGLMRPKWDERRGANAYGAQTIEKAIAACRQVYEPHSGHAPPASSNGDGGGRIEGAADEPQILFGTLRQFLEHPFPKAESLIGEVRGGTNLLPRFGWVMPWGKEGCGKTSAGADLMAHGACGLNWIGYPTLRAMRFVVVINEGVPGGMQDKLKEKVELWNGNKDDLLDRIAVYMTPWGEFNLRNERMRKHLRDFALDFQADYCYLDPLHTLGTIGAGAPAETEEFKGYLRALGVWESFGAITPHHSNKAGMVSGDWGRHPDTLIKLEKVNGRKETSWTIEKARPADPDELGVVQILEWIPETMGYKRTALADSKAKGADNREKVFDAARKGLTTIKAIAEEIELSEETVRKHLIALDNAGRLTLARGADNIWIVANVDEKEGAEE